MSTTSYRLLIVDDELAEPLSFYFRGDAVTQADSVLTAMAALQAQPFDVVLLDMQMPNARQITDPQAGLEVLRWIERQRPGLSVIVLTGHGSDDNVLAAVECGACAYVSKQIEPSQLVSLVHDIAQQAALRQMQYQQHIHDDVANARRQQQATFPPMLTLERHLPLSIAGRNVRATTASGDLFDFVAVPERHLLAFYLLDVTHHGLGSALIGARLSGLFRAGVRRGWSLAEIHESLDTTIADLDNFELSAEGVIGCLDVRAQRLDVIPSVNQPISHRTANHVTLVRFDSDLTGVALGRGRIMREAVPYPATQSIPFHRGDSVLFFTDGVASSEQHDRCEMVRRCHENATLGTVQQLADAVLHGVLACTTAGYGQAEQSGVLFRIDDDATVLALSW